MNQQQLYISAFGQILLFIIGGVVFILLTLFVSWLIRPHRPNPEKLSTYESGEEPVGNAWTQFNVRFYIVALIFLLFEVEIIFLFPWATIFAQKELQQQTNGAWGWFTVIEAVIFIVVLALGLAYAWAKGYLEWVKPDPQPTAYQSPVPKQLYHEINKRFATDPPKRKSTQDEELA